MLSSSKALGLTAQGLNQCCRAQCSHAMKCVPRGENLDLCLQVTLVHGRAVGTATPEQPKMNLLHVQSRKPDVTVVVDAWTCSRRVTATKHIQQIEQDYSGAIAFSNFWC